MEINDSTREFILAHRVARLATADGNGRPACVPVCYAFDGEAIYSPVDEKPKSVAAARLKRVRNIQINPHVSLVIDDYSEDWDRLAYVLISGVAEVLTPGDAAGEHERAVALLRQKYEQYLSMGIEDRLMIKIAPARVKHWRGQDVSP